MANTIKMSFTEKPPELKGKPEDAVHKRNRLKCTKSKLCEGSKDLYIEKYDYSGLGASLWPKGKSRGYLIRVFTPEGDDDPVRIDFCPVCGVEIGKFIK